MPDLPPSPNPRAPRPAGFDFTFHMRRLCEDIVERLPELSHVDIGRVAISFSQTRRASTYGLHATVRPLRLAGGSTEVIRRGRRWILQRLVNRQGREILYIVNFYLPRFLNLSFRDKLNTVIHELWHISPRFDGDLRRFRGRCYAHGGSRKRFEASIQRLADKYLGLHPPDEVLGFLHYDFGGLVARYGRVFGQRVRPPKMIPVDPSVRPSRAPPSGHSGSA